ncbi:MULTISPECIES: hypothetical protein [unclassified Curtobacterium]|uniref:hypothetical protein n=1 Tax=unclassified Curtobacterium TaxID=257496 RepID=UPI00382835FC
MSTSLIALATAIGPAVLGVLGRLLFTESRPLRSIKRHAQLLAELPAAAKPALEEVIVAETRRYADRTLDRARRKLNGGNLSALIVVGIFTAAVIYFGVVLALQVSGWWWIPTSVIGLFLLLLTGAGFGKNFWTYPEEEPTLSGA